MPIGVMLRLVCGRFSAVETWYSRGASTITDGITAGNALVAARAQCLSSNCYIEGFRVFNSAVKYDVRNVDLSQPAGGAVLGVVGGLPATGPNLADIQSTSLLNKALGTAGGRARTGNRELFGVPDNVVQTTPQGNRIYTPTVAFSNGLDAYVAQLTAFWDFRVLKITPRHVITGLVIDSAPPGLLGLRVDIGGDGLILAGKRVRIRNALRQTTLNRLNGLWTVSRVDGPVAPSTQSTVYLVGSTQIDTGGYDPLGTLEGIDFEYCHVADYTVQRPMGRKRGGRSGLSRGRSPARAR